MSFRLITVALLAIAALFASTYGLAQNPGEQGREVIAYVDKGPSAVVARLKQTLEKVRADLKTMMEERQSWKEQRDELLETMNEIKVDHLRLKARLKQLQQEIKALSKVPESGEEPKAPQPLKKSGSAPNDPAPVPEGWHKLQTKSESSGKEGKVANEQADAIPLDGQVAIEGARFLSPWFEGRILSRKKIRRYVVQSSGVSNLAVSPNGGWGASTAGGTVRLWNLGSSTGHAVLHLPARQLLNAAFAPGGDRLAVAGSGLFLLDVNSRKVLWSAESGWVARWESLDFSKDGKFLATRSREAVTIWKSKTGEKLRTCQLPWKGSDFYGFNLLDENTLFIAGNSYESGNRIPDGKAKLVNLETGNPIWELVFPKDPYGPQDAVLMPDRERVITVGTLHGVVEVWEAATGYKTTWKDTEEASLMELSDSGKVLITGGPGNVTAWHVPTGRIIEQFRFPKYGQESAKTLFVLAASADGHRVLFPTPGHKRSITLCSFRTRVAVHQHQRKSKQARQEQDEPDKEARQGPSHDADQNKEANKNNKEVQTKPLPADPNQQIVRFPNHSKSVQSIAISPDGRWGAVAGLDGQLRIWDLRSRKVIKAIPLIKRNTSVGAVRFSPDGESLFAGSYFKAKMIDVGPWKVRWTAAARSSPHYGIAFSPDSRIVAVPLEEGIALRSVETGRLIKKLEITPDSLVDIAIGPGGQEIFVAGNYYNNGTTPITWYGRLWNWKTGEETFRTKYPVESVAWDEERDRIYLIGQGDNIEVWSPDTGKRLKIWDEGSDCLTFDLTGDGRYLALGLEGAVELWDTHTAKRVDRVELPEVRFSILSVQGDGAFALVATKSADAFWGIHFHIPGRTPRTVERSHDRAKSITAPIGRLLKPIATIAKQQAPITAFALSPNGRRLYIATRGQVFSKWNLESNEELDKHEIERGLITEIAVSCDRGRLLTIGLQSNLSEGAALWNANRWTVLRKLGTNTAGKPDERSSFVKRVRERVSTAALSPSGKFAAISYRDSNVRLWDVETGEILQTLSAPVRGMYELAFSPDGTTLAGVGPAGVWAWDVESGHLIGRLPHHDRIAFRGATIDFSPKTGHLLVPSRDGLLEVRLRQGGLASRVIVAPHKEESPGQPAQFSMARYSPNGELILARGHRGVILYDAQTGAELASIPGEVIKGRAFAFTPDGKHILTQGTENALIVWAIKKSDAPANLNEAGDAPRPPGPVAGLRPGAAPAH